MAENDRTQPPDPGDAGTPEDKPLDPMIEEPPGRDSEDDEDAERSKEGSPRPE